VLGSAWLAWGNTQKDAERFGELLGREETQGAISRILELSEEKEKEKEKGEEFELGLPDNIMDIWEH
jgi:hypothetical protein